MCCYPSDFEAKFRTLLADRADAFFQSLAQPSVQGLRVNLCKTSANAFLAHSGLSLTSVPWCAEGFMRKPCPAAEQSIPTMKRAYITCKIPAPWRRLRC
ncbi:MAG: hypothetical protein ACLUVV_02705 [Christensenellales bacterium]